ncbi:MAG: DUF3131 domain-containing protein [bacterium]|nr:DUF3131 domain-containing protein [bacterium]
MRSTLEAEQHGASEHYRAAEWFLDNYFYVQRAVRQVRQDMPHGFFRRLPALSDGDGAGLPRAYVLAACLLREAELIPDSDRIQQALASFQWDATLTMAELWALPAFLRLGTLEQLVGALAEVSPEVPSPLPPSCLGAALPRADVGETVGCCIRTLRWLDGVDWRAFFRQASQVEHILERDPARTYALTDSETRDRCCKQVEEIALRTGRDEPDVARAAVARAGTSSECGPRYANVGYWLIGDGRCELERELGYRPPLLEALRRALTARPTLTLVGGTTVMTAAVLAYPVSYLAARDAGALLWWVGLLLLLLPASTLGATLVQWVLTNVLPPRVLPKLDSACGFPEDCRTLVAVPCLLGSVREVQGLVRELELHYLRNADEQLEFALLSDWVDAPEETLPSDSELLRRVEAGIQLLNRKHGKEGRGPFHLLHRRRLWNPSEGVWMGFERKRGKLEELNRLLLEGASPGLDHVVGRPDGLLGVRYVITLDAGTLLPQGAAGRLVGVLAHPLNRPELDPKTGRIRRGYTVVQPRVEILPTAAARSCFTRLFAGDAAIDIYSRAVSDVYQDLCAEGIYVGKGAYDVAAFARSLAGRVPENALVSHDHFEGLHGRVALASDIVLYEDYPSHYVAYARRLHRWVRGDWQLLPWLGKRVPEKGGGRAPNRFTVLGRWILFDNLRRSLLTPGLLLVLAAGWLWLPGHPIVWCALGVLAPAGHVFTGLVSGLVRGPRRNRVRAWAARLVQTLRQNAGRWFLYIVFLAHEAIVVTDAILRTLFRLTITRRHLLEWRTAEHTARLLAARRPHTLVWREMAGSPLVALVLLAALAAWRSTSIPWASPFLALWILAPEIARRVSLPRAPVRETMPRESRSHLRRIGRRTWFFFETFVGPEDQWLPPDNYQENPRGEIAHRTSPTNIGMYLVAAVAARDMGWLGPMELLFRVRNTLETLGRMSLYRGHLYNWYDTRTLEPLLPHYVSTVDSGNLAAALLVVQQACAEAATSSVLTPASWRGLLDCLELFERSVRDLARADPQLVAEPFLERLARLRADVRDACDQRRRWLALVPRLLEVELPALDRALMDAVATHSQSDHPEILHEVRVWMARTHQHVQGMGREIAQLLPWAGWLEEAPTRVQSCTSFRRLEAFLPVTSSPTSIVAACEEALLLLPAIRAECGAGDAELDTWFEGLHGALVGAGANAQSLQQELLGLGVRADELARAMEFDLLFDDERFLFHIGYNVTSGERDANRYDLLASEARIASFLAIAKGDAPVKHWFFLGRPMTRLRGAPTLLSWGATMFEYLMPALLMRSGDDTLLAQSCRVAVAEQLEYGRRRRVPWGISESGFHGFDADRNYQYRAFGVPGLGLRRGLADDLVVAPYASVLALSFAPRAVCENLSSLEALGASGPFGLFEAVDFTPERAPFGRRYAVVESYMAHHQGMILAAIDNYLNGEPLQRRFHDSSLVQSTELLLHEGVPAGVSPQMQLESLSPLPRPSSPRSQMPSWRPPSGGALPEAQVLSNGRMTTVLTASGGGSTTWCDMALTRWSADPTRDAGGTWIYVRDEETQALWSVGDSPVGVEPEEQHVIYHAHAVEYHRRVHGLFVHMEVTVAPHDDVEIRLIRLTNETHVPRRLIVSSCLEPVLAPLRDDERHPAFSKLFIESEYVADEHTLVFQRRPRRQDEQAVVLAQRLVEGVGSRFRGYETDRARFLGRGRTWERPRALDPGGTLSGTVGAVLDPVGVLQGAVELAPGQSARIAFLSCAASTRQAALETAGRFRSISAAEWAFEDAQAVISREVRDLGVNPELLPTFQRLASLLLHASEVSRCDPALIRDNRASKRRLWGHGISGDLPILLLEISDPNETRLLAELIDAHRWWRRRGTSVDLIVLLTGSSNYAGEDEEAVTRLMARRGAADSRNRRGGIFILHADQMPPDERRLVLVAARVVVRESSGPLAGQIRELDLDHDLPPRFVPTHDVTETSEATPALEDVGELLFDNGLGGFSRDGREYVIELDPGQRTPSPWCNVLANPRFGCLVSESGLGMTWSQNSAERRLTTWRNDPVADEPAEVVYLRDEETGVVWTPTPLPAGEDVAFRVRHGAGWSDYRSSSQGLEQRLRVFVPRDDPVKVVSLRLRNLWSRPRRLTVTYYAELVLGAVRAEALPFTCHEYDGRTGALLAGNAWDPEHGGRVAFLVSDTLPHAVTVDRLEFLGRNGNLRQPAALRRWGLSGRVRAGVDPCHVSMVHIELAPASEREVHFVLGDGASREHALDLAARYRSGVEIARAWEALRAFWDEILGAVEVETPEPAMNIALNRWLLYQTIASRVEGRTGMYQSSGAFGFRDQLQDVLALVHTAPERTRAHVLDAARRQFEAGDVLHWWHPPLARGVRTRCSDDLLWLPYVAASYAQATGDLSIFEEPVPFLSGEPLADNEVERYAEFATTEHELSLLEHCRRALDRALTSGPHGLPLIGSCDWNDGFSRVGEGGIGESVWLAWFAIATLRSFAGVLDELGHGEESNEYRQRAEQLAERVDRHAWDGAWYLRAWYDDGTPLGSASSRRCRIDVIAQAWAALSGAGDPRRTSIALDSAREQLVREEDGLVRLLAPPFDLGHEDPGYIRAYPPGIRENGGQYTHAATWLGWAFAAVCDGREAERIFRLLNPILHATSPDAVARYRVEPYVVAADVYGLAPHTGRGGWTWYTGAAAWLWRLGVEAILGLRRVGGDLVIEPCIPPDWEGFRAMVRTSRCQCRVVVENPHGVARGVASVTLDGEELPSRRVALTELEGQHEVVVRMGR